MNARKTVLLAGLALLFAAMPSFGEEKATQTRRVADVYRQLLQERMKNIERLRQYHEQGVFPRNYYRPGQVPVFVDVHGTHCAVGYLVKESGNTDLVSQIVKLDNYVYVKDVKDGPFIDWIAWSGLTQEECARIQPTYNWRPPRPPIPPSPPFVPPPPDFVPPPPTHPVGIPDPDDRRIKEHLVRVEAELRANTFASLEKAMKVLQSRNKELFVGKNFAVVAPPVEKSNTATITLKNLSRSRQSEVVLTFLNGSGEIVKQEIPKFQSQGDCHRKMLAVNEEIQVAYDCKDTWVVVEWSTGPGLNITVPFQTIADAREASQARK